MSDLVRTQILLDKKQRELLDEIAKNEGLSFSELVRTYLDLQIRQRKYEEMHLAAEQLRADYETGGALSDMTALDREDFIDV